MSASRTPRTPRTAKAVPETTTIVVDEGETPLAAIIRLSADPTPEHVETMLGIVATADDALRLATFEGRVTTSAMVGYTLKAQATVTLGLEPESFPKACATVGVTDKNREQWLGRSFSTLDECWRISSHHSGERVESFIATYREAHGVNPESVRAYSVWISADAKGGKAAAKNTVDTLKARRDAAAKAKVKAEEVAKAKASQRVVLAKAKAKAKADDVVVVGCPLTKAQWDGMDEATLANVALLAETMRAAKAKARRAASDATAKATADAETGPTAQRTRRGAKVAS